MSKIEYARSHPRNTRVRSRLALANPDLLSQNRHRLAAQWVADVSSRWVQRIGKLDIIEDEHERVERA